MISTPLALVTTAEIVAVPAATPVTEPVSALTVATAALLLVYAILSVLVALATALVTLLPFSTVSWLLSKRMVWSALAVTVTATAAVWSPQESVTVVWPVFFGVSVSVAVPLEASAEAETAATSGALDTA